MSELPAPPVPSWNPIPAYERRVLGVLIEKQKTSKSPDAYPMTLNAITTGCNQKSNRDPVYDLDEDVVEEALGELQKTGMVVKITGGRVERWRHTLYDVWKVTKVEMAILAELLMRGSQTEGDLRGRASRMDEIADLDELRNLLKGLRDRKFVVYLTEPNRRGTVVTHGFYEPAELERERTRHSGSATEADVPASRSAASATGLATLEARLDEAFAEIAKLKDAITKLQTERRV